MSELIHIQKRNENFRHGLLTNVSILALMGAFCLPSAVLAASDEDKPTVWIELGGQLERLDTPQAFFAPPFFGFANPSVLDVLTDGQRPSRYSTGLEGKISFEPHGTDWVFSAAIRYGQVKGAKHLHYETPGIPAFRERLVSAAGNVVTPSRRNFGDSQAHSADSDSVLDFQAGKDVGLGLFGVNASSVVSVGVRYAQFTSRSDDTIHARPVLGYHAPVPYTLIKYHGTVRHAYSQTYTAIVHSIRNTHAIGPSLTWNASMPVVGNRDGMTVNFDWGVNAAALFGRQRTHEDHHTTGNYHNFNVNVAVVRHYAYATAHDRSNSVFIPNVGGFAGVSLKFPNAKVSLGYRGDFFFNATDKGLDARDAANQNFYGPFATISIGLGG